MSLMEQRVRDYNNSNGDLQGYDCPLCKNRGDFWYIKNGLEYMRWCSCWEIRKGIRRAEASGLDSLLQRCTFEKFRTDHEWQRHIKNKALDYLSAPAETWFFAGGQPGAGKTHLCTAITAELIKHGKEARYCLWRDTSLRLRGQITDSEKYSDEMERLKRIEVLYLDDFLKAQHGSKPTPAEITLAFELINARYNARLTTIISSEFTSGELIRLDEALASRIIELCGSHCINISRDSTRNYRLSGMSASI